jgi:hypothetical protein
MADLLQDLLLTAFSFSDRLIVRTGAAVRGLSLTINYSLIATAKNTFFTAAKDSNFRETSIVLWKRNGIPKLFLNRRNRALSGGSKMEDREMRSANERDLGFIRRKVLRLPALGMH